jgi:hypothetical protein
LAVTESAAAAARLLQFVERTWPDLAGPDPYDALNSPVVRRLAGSSRLRRIGWLQLLRLAPWDARPWLGLRPHKNPKTVSLFVRAYLRLAGAGGSGAAAAERHARECLNWLESNATPGFSGAAWGYSFAWQSRRLWLDAGQPSAVCTAFVARAFLDAYAIWREPGHLAVAQSAAQFLLRDCPRSAGCISYIPQHTVAVHNANMLSAATLAQVWRAGGCPSELRDVAEEAVAFTVADQRPDGAWTYDASTAERSSFVDGFHTGLVLEALQDVGQALEVDYSKQLDGGLAFYRQQMIGADGRPRRLLHRTAATDIRDCAQALVVLNRFGLSAEQRAVMDWTFAHMRRPDGYFIYQSGGPLAGLNHIAFPRWQGWMLLALTDAKCAGSAVHAGEGVA